MERRRTLGVVSGLITLVAVFALPFGSDLYSPSLFSSVLSVLGELGRIQQSGDSALVALTYIVIGMFVLLVIAGAVGVFPLGAGVLALIGMTVITLASTLVSPGTSLNLPLYGVGYFVVWAASVAALATHFSRARVEKAPPIPPPEVAPLTPPPLPPPLPRGALYVPKVAPTQTPVSEEAESVGLEAGLEVSPGETTPEEVVETVNSLRRRKQSGEISSEQLREEVQKMIFRDASGRFWTIDFRFGRWVCHEGEAWAPRTPPSRLTPVA